MSDDVHSVTPADDNSIPLPPIAPLRPPASPSDMRAGMVADELAIAARAGVKLEPREAEQLVDRDLAIFDAVARDAPAYWSPTPSSPAEQREHAAERGAKKRELLATAMAAQPELVPARKSRALQAPSLPGERWSYAKGRIKRLLAGLTPHVNPKIAASTCDQPALAEEVIVMFWQVATTQGRRQSGQWGPEPPGEHNPFWGVSMKDFGRVLQARVESICDRSTGCPGYGPWWVPK